MEQGEIVIQITSEPRCFCVVRAAVEAAALVYDLGPFEAGQVKLAVTEALANVARHGYKGRPDQPICIKLAPAQNGQQRGLTIEIEDECLDVDLRQIKGRPLDEIRPGGLGVHIIREIMDHVEYRQRSNGHGVCLRMSKFAATNSPAQEE